MRLNVSACGCSWGFVGIRKIWCKRSVGRCCFVSFSVFQISIIFNPVQRPNVKVQACVDKEKPIWRVTQAAADETVDCFTSSLFRHGPAEGPNAACKTSGRFPSPTKHLEIRVALTSGDGWGMRFSVALNRVYHDKLEI